MFSDSAVDNSNNLLSSRVSLDAEAEELFKKQLAIEQEVNISFLRLYNFRSYYVIFCNIKKLLTHQRTQKDPDSCFIIFVCFFNPKLV